MRNILTPFIALATLLGLSACATTLNFSTPETVNLSGIWAVEPSVSQQVIFPTRNESGKGLGGRGGERGKGPKGGGRGRDGQGRGERPKQDQGSNVSDGQTLNPQLANAKELTIDHVNDSMGILYVNGKYRDVDWGKTEQRNKTVTAGWNAEELVVKTEARGKTLKEIYFLDQENDVLTIKFTVDGNEYLRVYTRKQNTPDSKELSILDSR